MQVLPYAANMYAKVLMAFKFSGRCQCGNFSCQFSFIGKELKYEISQLFSLGMLWFFRPTTERIGFCVCVTTCIEDFIDCLDSLSDYLRFAGFFFYICHFLKIYLCFLMCNLYFQMYWVVFSRMVDEDLYVIFVQFVFL